MNLLIKHDFLHPEMPIPNFQFLHYLSYDLVWFLCIFSHTLKSRWILLLISLNSRIKHNKHIKSKSRFKMNRPKDFKNKNSTTLQHHQQKQHKNRTKHLTLQHQYTNNIITTQHINTQTCFYAFIKITSISPK